MNPRPHNFIHYLEALDEDRGALAALRRGLGQPPGSVPDMHRFVIPRLPADTYPGSWTESTYYLIASLFALHPDGTEKGNMGDHFYLSIDQEVNNSEAVERRFTAFLTADPADLHIYLRQAVSFLRSKEVPVNWHQLMWHVLDLGYPDSAERVQKRWARSFWRYRSAQTADTDAP